jgi:uracil-DNA glycosylase
MSGQERLGPADLARVLVQRMELGHSGPVLDRWSKHEALAVIRQFKETPVSGQADESLPAEQVSPRIRGEGKGISLLVHPEESRGSKTPGQASSPATGPDLDELKAMAESCTRCRLSSDRTQAVFSDGRPDARLMVVGEAPGAKEDQTGVPFVGPAGKLLDLLLASVSLSRQESVYICNVIKCRPPGNRDPKPDEIEACTMYLKAQIRRVSPEVILAVGSFAGKFLAGLERPLGKLRGEIYSYEGTPVVVTYHPAALLRNQTWLRATWDDFQLLRGILDSKAGADA